MAEILGIVAVAAQLATYAIALGNIALSIKSSKSIITEHRQFLGDLRLIADCIGRNPVLQTSEVEQLTKSIIATVDASPIREVLFKASKYRFVRAVHTVTVVLHQKQIQDLFRSVEQQKSTLSLSIAQIQTLQLLEIKSNIHTMSSHIPRPRDQGSEEELPFLQDSQAPYNGSIVPYYGERHTGGGSEYSEQYLAQGGYDHGRRDIPQSPADFRRCRHFGNGPLHIGTSVSGRISGSLLDCTSNELFIDNVKERPAGDSGHKKHSQCAMTLGVTFSDGAIAERYGGTWINNIQNADASMHLGAVIKGKKC